MVHTPIILTFVDPAGNPIANGTLRIRLNADAKSSVQVVSKVFNLTLDINGSADIAYIVAPSALTNSFGTNQSPSYIVEVYSATGELIFGPNEANNPILPVPPVPPLLLL